MKPLLFLTGKSFVNGIKRALTSPKRIISLLFLVGYWTLVINRPMGGSSHVFYTPGVVPKLTLPAIDLIEAIVFGLLALLSLGLSMQVFGGRAGFRPADVDVLFPTPVSPKVVLVFRIVRDYLFTLLLPLVFILISWRPTAAGATVLISNLPNPSTAGYVFKALSIAWVLMALSWVSINYAGQMFVNRTDLDSDRNRKWLGYALLFSVLSVTGYLYLSLHTAEGPPTFGKVLAVTRSPFIRIVFFTATFGTEIVMGPLKGTWGSMLLGVGGLVGTIAFGFGVAFTQVQWLYDQAAARGFDVMTTRALQQKGDIIGLLAAQARRGKLKVGKQGWLSRVKARGWTALIWKEAIIIWRGMRSLFVLMAGVSLVMTILPLTITGGKGLEVGAFFLMMQGFSMFMMTMSFAQMGFIELLRRVDLQKPLPFQASTVVFGEIIGKAFPAAIVSWISCLVALVMRPAIWGYVAAGAILGPLLSVLLCSAIFLVTVLFPDVDDPTQRGFRGLMTLLSLVLLCAPVGAIFIGVMIFVNKYSYGPIVAAIPSAGLAAALSVAVAFIGGGLYANYNPSE